MAAAITGVGVSCPSKLNQAVVGHRRRRCASVVRMTLLDEKKKTYTLKKSEEAFNAAKELMPGGVNSPVRAFKSVGGQPIIIDSVKGSHMWDIDGNEYIDYVGSWGPAIIGHADDEVLAALAETMKKGTSFGAPCLLENVLAEMVISAVPSIEMVRFVNSGTEACMGVLRLARAFTGREKIIKFEGCYHGHADPFLVKAGSGVATLGLPDSPGVPRAATNETLTSPYNDISTVESIFEANKGELAAVILEPVVGNAGFIPPKPEFINFLRKITKDNGTLLIFDEVMTGFRLSYGKKGVKYFLEYSFRNASINERILCPCKGCKMGISVTKETAKDHLMVDGFIPNYTQWIAHGELPTRASTVENQQDNAGTSSNVDNMQDLVHDALGIQMEYGYTEDTADFSQDADIASGQAGEFFKLIDASQQKLYEGCENFTKLSFIIRLLHLKCLGRLNNKVFDMFLDLLREAFPDAMTDLPKSYYEAEKLLKDLGLGYEKIDACPNDCTLYWGVNAKRTSCETCHELRWHTSDKDMTGIEKKISRKVLWYFPLKPRLQRLFMSSKTASHMRWHAEGRTKDGNMRHPADSPAWKSFDRLHPEFAKDHRNVRLGLASDGFNPFKNMSTQHSTWPVILIPYNLPPWMCMKQPYFMLSLLIPGPLAPGNNIDIYLQPLIADLKDLWDVGVETFDALNKQNFQLHASLLWTISDFPGYANLSGWSTKGEFACPACNKHTHSLRLRNGGKYCYMGHRKFLPEEHDFRKNGQMFDGTVEYGQKPPHVSGDMILDELKDFFIKFGKLVTDNPKLPFNWKKKSIFFDLPYWKDNVLRHNLDVMHIEKNVCESICGTLLEIDGKSKDNYKSRLDLKAMGIRPDLHPINKDSGKVYLPPASFTMSRSERTMFCEILQKIKVPDGYASNISRCVQLKPPKLLGLKSHDYHILMQQLMSVALRKTLSKSVRSPLLQLSKYFRELCSKVICPADVLRLEKDIVVIICQLEKIFPPSFFDIMVHLTIHLATEVKLAGPVYYRWMYPVERYLGTLKSYVRNRGKPEGSIARGYLAEECLTFCSLYLADYVETKINRMPRNENLNANVTCGLDIFTVTGRALGKGISTRFDADTLKRAHQYVLFNCDDISAYIEKYRTIVGQTNPRVSRHQFERIISESFADWFAINVDDGLHTSDESLKARDLKLLAGRPNFIGLKYKKFLVNGFRFHTKGLESTRKTQNCGVCVKAATPSFSSIRDQNPILGHKKRKRFFAQTTPQPTTQGGDCSILKIQAMANKFRKHNNFHLQDESIILRSRLTGEDRPRDANAESFVQNHMNIGSRTRTQVGKRISNGSMHQMRASPARRNQKNSVERQSNYRLREQPGVENEFLNDSLTRKNAMENLSNHRLTEDPRVEEEFMNASFEQEYEEGSVNGTGVIEKQTRGPTYMQNIWGRAPNMPLLHVEYNEYGQPIGGENSKLCHFLGSIARNDKYCPVDVKDWHAFPTTKKKDILDVVKVRFQVTAAAEKWILSSVGNKWKNWKYTLKTKYWCENVAIEHLIEERDERVPVDKWVKLLTFWNTEEAKEISQRNEIARSKKIMNQRTGKRSFAQIKAKMTKEKGRSPTRVELFNSCFVPSNGTPNDVISSKYSAMLERSDQLSEGFSDAIGPDDVFAQVMGKDASGHVRMMGQGVCPRDVWSETPISKSNRLLMEHQATIAHLQNMLSMQQKSLQHNKGQYTLTSLSPNASSTLSLEVGNYVSLRSLFDPKRVVAEGYVHNTEPTTKVGGQLLGMNWCEVNVKVAIEPEEQLIRPYSNVQKISQTIGAMVAWPCSLVTPTEDL